MKSLSTVLLFLCAMIPATAQSIDKRPHSLAVHQSTSDPMFVTVTAPADFATQAKNWDGHWNKWGGAGFSINWGDGSMQVPNPAMRGKAQSVASHTYHVAGTYKITASRFHPGPDDGPVSDWYDSVTVSVSH